MNVHAVWAGWYAFLWFPNDTVVDKGTGVMLRKILNFPNRWQHLLRKLYLSALRAQLCGHLGTRFLQR